MEAAMSQMTETSTEQLKEKEVIFSQLAQLTSKYEKLEQMQSEVTEEKEKLSMEVLTEQASSLKMKEEVRFDFNHNMSPISSDALLSDQRIAALPVKFHARETRVTGGVLMR
eukprot:762682-Hanusia_phi.AAC.3